MTNVLNIGLSSIGIGLVLSIPSVALGYWLQKSRKGPNNSKYSLPFCIAVVLFQRIWFPNLRFELLALIVILGSTLGMYTVDIYWAMKRVRPDQ